MCRYDDRQLTRTPTLARCPTVPGQPVEKIYEAAETRCSNWPAGSSLRERYDKAVEWGRLTNRYRDWDGEGNHPGYTLALRLATEARPGPVDRPSGGLRAARARW